jgi:hypothetical protein
MQRTLFVFLLFISTAAVAQTVLPVPRNLQSTYKKETRTTGGKPGKNYWQNSAAYDININFDPVTRVVSGTVNIEYVNNSPDSLTQIWFKLYPNLYKKGNIRMQPVRPEDVTDGIQISKMKINGEERDVKKLRIDGTNMTVGIKPLLSKQTTRFSIEYSYTLNKESHIRTGEIEKGADFVAYFFPRIAVYDDIDGWNRYPYTGPQEFYNDFCRFNAAISVPANYIVWATGDLLNCNEVLNEKYCSRIESAEKNDAITSIIDTTDLAAGNISKQNANNVWKFSAADVTDFVFAVSDHYIWKSSSLEVDKKTHRRTRVDAVFNPAHKDYFEVIGFARKTVEAMSYVFPRWPYPYNHETVFDGLDQMEYPMMVNDNPLDDRNEAIELTDHEIFHTMFPFYMGINETKYGWMDEGWATIGEWIISPLIDTNIIDEYGVRGYEDAAGKEVDLPIMTLTTQLNGTAMFINSYPKPAMGYLYIKDMLGDELFHRALHYYFEQWHGKHPMPFDFFNCMNTGAGKNMNWFWKKWFFDDGVPDLGIKNVSPSKTGYTIIITSKGNKPVPVDLEILFSDGTETTVHRSIAVWEKGNTVLSISISTKKIIQKIVLGSTYVPDVDKTDNTWTKK